MKQFIKKTIILLWCVVMMFSFTLVSNAFSENTAMEFYVSGDVSNTGDAKSPFKTIERAKNESKKYTDTVILIQSF